MVMGLPTVNGHKMGQHEGHLGYDNVYMFCSDHQAPATHGLYDKNSKTA